MSRALGPGPAAYALPPLLGYDKHDSTKTRRPQYSFGTKTLLKKGKLGPGPAAYNPMKFTRYGSPHSPAYSLGERTKIDRRKIGPGPAAYNTSGSGEYTGPRAPAYSLGVKTMLLNKSIGPGPNAYELKLNFVKPLAPAYSLGQRTKIISRKGQSPGPAAYYCGQNCIDNIKKRNPAYVMGIRTSTKVKHLGPGPSAYLVKLPDSAPAYTFGVKHSPYAPPMIVECDN